MKQVLHFAPETLPPLATWWRIVSFPLSHRDIGLSSFWSAEVEVSFGPGHPDPLEPRFSFQPGGPRWFSPSL